MNSKIFGKCKYKDLKISKQFCVYKHAYDMWKLIMQNAAAVFSDSLIYLSDDLSTKHIDIESEKSLLLAVIMTSTIVIGRIEKFICSVSEKKCKYYDFKKLLKRRKKLKFLRRKFKNQLNY